MTDNTADKDKAIEYMERVAQRGLNLEKFAWTACHVYETCPSERDAIELLMTRMLDYAQDTATLITRTKMMALAIQAKDSVE